MDTQSSPERSTSQPAYTRNRPPSIDTDLPVYDDSLCKEKPSPVSSMRNYRTFNFEEEENVSDSSRNSVSSSYSFGDWSLGSRPAIYLDSESSVSPLSSPRSYKRSIFGDGSRMSFLPIDVISRVLRSCGLHDGPDRIITVIRIRKRIMSFLEEPVPKPFVCPPEMYKLPSGLLAIMDEVKIENVLDVEEVVVIPLPISSETYQPPMSHNFLPETPVVLPKKKRGLLQRFIRFFICGGKQ
jgi:hypothetical protein